MVIKFSNKNLQLYSLLYKYTFSPCYFYIFMLHYGNHNKERINIEKLGLQGFRTSESKCQDFISHRWILIGLPLEG